MRLRDGRRRRVLVEEAILGQRRAVAVPTPTDGSGNRAGRTRRYTTEAHADQQQRITDLIPVRRWTLSVWFLSSLTVLTGIVAASLIHFNWSARLGPTATAALNMQAAGSLAAWTSSLCLASATMLAAVIYHLRRYRIDDYRGHYRIWIVFTICLLAASVDATARVSHFVIVALRYALELRGHGRLIDQWGWPPLSLVVLALVVRSFLEVRASRGTTATLVACVGCYAASGLAASGRLPLYDPMLRGMAVGTPWLAGNLLLMLALLCYARFVFLDAQDALTTRQQRPRRALANAGQPKSDSRSVSDESGERSDPDILEMKPRDQKVRESQQTSGSVPVADADPHSANHQNTQETSDADREGLASDSGYSRLSKSERRRLRKEKRRQRSAA